MQRMQSKTLQLGKCAVKDANLYGNNWSYG